MSARISRRAVFAQVLLDASPRSLHVRNDGTSISVEFDTVAELQQWLADSGILAAEPNVVQGERISTRPDGSQSRYRYAYPDNFHGWEVYASASEETAEPLDDATREQLRVVADETPADLDAQPDGDQ